MERMTEYPERKSGKFDLDVKELGTFQLGKCSILLNYQ